MLLQLIIATRFWNHKEIKKRLLAKPIDMNRCATGKIVFQSESLGEDALIDVWIRNNYQAGQGPVAIYRCDDCGNFHFTSKGAMNERLKKELDNGSILKYRRGFDFERKLGRE